MPIAKGRGGKNRKKGKSVATNQKRDLLVKDKDAEQEYAQVLRMLGNGKVEASCFDGRKRICNIRGKMRKKVWINVGDVILLSVREFQDDKADVIHKYNNDEIRALKQQNEIPDHITGNTKDQNESQQEGGGLQFVENSSDEEGDDDDSNEDNLKQGRNYDLPSSSSEEEEEYDPLGDI